MCYLFYPKLYEKGIMVWHYMSGLCGISLCEELGLRKKKKTNQNKAEELVGCICVGIHHGLFVDMFQPSQAENDARLVITSLLEPRQSLI